MLRIAISLLVVLASADEAGGQGVYYAKAAAGGGPTQLYTNAFNIADTSSLGAAWNESNGDAQIVGNELLMAASASTPTILITTTTAHAAVADCKVYVTQVTQFSESDGGPIARCTDGDASPTMYAADVFNPNTLNVYRHNNSASGTLIATTSITYTANGVITLEVTGTGATVTLKATYNGVEVVNTTDTSGSRLTAAGQCGIYSWSGATDDRNSYDNFGVVTAP